MLEALFEIIGEFLLQIVVEVLVLTPLLAGGIMAVLGAWRARRGQTVLRIDRFAYGYLFALGLAVVRFWFAQ
jgi:hypothetical protein